MFRDVPECSMFLILSTTPFNLIFLLLGACNRIPKCSEGLESKSYTDHRAQSLSELYKNTTKICCSPSSLLAFFIYMLLRPFLSTIYN